MPFVMLKEQAVGHSGVGGLKHLEGGRRGKTRVINQ